MPLTVDEWEWAREGSRAIVRFATLSWCAERLRFSRRTIVLGQCIEKLTHGFVFGRHEPFARDFGEGGQHEPTFVKTWMGQDEIIVKLDERTKKEKIEVQRPGSPALLRGPIAPSLAFDAVEMGKELERRGIGLGDGGGVDEITLDDGADGSCGMEGGDSDKACARKPGDSQQGCAKMRFAVADIGSEGDSGEGGHAKG